MPITEEDGYAEEAQLIHVGHAEQHTVNISVASDGTIVLSGGWSTFVDSNIVAQGTEVVFWFDFGDVDVGIYVYDFWLVSSLLL